MPCLVLWFVLGAGLPSNVRSRSGQRCSPSRNGRLARPCDRSAYTYTPSGRSPALLVSFSRVPPRCGPDRDRAWHPREFGAVLGVSASHTSSDRLRRLGPRPRVIPRSLRRRSRRLRGDTRRNASSAGYRLLALRRVSPRIRRTASPHVAQFGTRPLVPCLTFHKARLSSQHLRSPTFRQRS